MLKIVISGNSQQGWDGQIDVPAELDKSDKIDKGGLHVISVGPDEMQLVFPQIRNHLLQTYGFDILTKEFLVVHECRAFEQPNTPLKYEYVDEDGTLSTVTLPSASEILEKAKERENQATEEQNKKDNKKENHYSPIMEGVIFDKEQSTDRTKVYYIDGLNTAIKLLESGFFGSL